MVSTIPSEYGSKDYQDEPLTTASESARWHALSLETQLSTPRTVIESKSKPNQGLVSPTSSSDDMLLSSNTSATTSSRNLDSPGMLAQIVSPVESALKTVYSVKFDFDRSFAATSRDLALQDHEVKGEVQSQPALRPEVSVNDLGWHKQPSDMPDSLIGGVANGNLFAMIRRFNKDIFDVRALAPGQNDGLDLNEAWDDEHAGIKLMMNLQRIYLSIVLGCASFGNQLSRLRSWKETRRTAIFCACYLIAWHFNLLISLLLGTLVLLTSSKSMRSRLFPSAPIALVNITTGGLQKPPAGQLGTSDTLTGAPEKAIGEAREEEAANFVSNARHLMARAVGMHDSNDNEGDPLEGKVPKPIRNVIKSVRAAGTDPGHSTNADGKDMTQKPMEDMLWNKVQPKMIEPLVKALPHVIGEVVDTWERIANTISPRPPFSNLAVLRLEILLVPLFMISLLVPQYFVYKTTGFGIGFVLFGDPIISRGLALLHKEYPGWPKLLEPKNNILRGIPTNNQLTLTLLRIGEVHQSPIPPLPATKATDVNLPSRIVVGDIPLSASHLETARAIQPSSIEETKEDDSSPEKPGEKPSKNHRSLTKFISGVRKGATATIQAKLRFDHVRTAAGSKKAIGHVGILTKIEDIIYAGPSEFKARYNGKNGWLYITSQDPTEPYLLFTTEDPRGNHDRIESLGREQAAWSMAVNNIRRLKRAEAFASKPVEKAAEWSDDRELLASIEIGDKEEKTWRFNAIPERDELFNRLIALGTQSWENM